MNMLGPLLKIKLSKSGQILALANKKLTGEEPTTHLSVEESSKSTGE